MAKVFAAQLEFATYSSVCPSIVSNIGLAFRSADAAAGRREYDVRVVTSGLVLGAAVTLVYACEGRSRHAPPSRQYVQWRSLGSWSGRGDAQTGSFPSVTGSMRVQWRTDHNLPGDTGMFRLTIHSAVSGRPLLVAVDQIGAGHEISDVHESPRTFYGVVESRDLDWSFTVEEAVQFDLPP